MVVPILCAKYTHILHQNLQNSPSLFLVLVPLHHLLPVQKSIETYSLLSTATSQIFLSIDPSIPCGCVNETACGGDLGSISLQSSSSKRKARHFVLMKLVLDRVAELTPRNKKLYKMIQTRLSALCKLRKMYKAKKPKEVSQLHIKSLIQSLSSSLNVDTSRFLASIYKYKDNIQTMSDKVRVCCLMFDELSKGTIVIAIK